MNSLAQQAVVAALEGRWPDAAKLNKQILSANSRDFDALNRLGRAYLELGKKNDAISTYKKVLRIDPYNSIARKAVDRLSKVHTRLRQNTSLQTHNKTTTSATSFLEEPGKTKTANLIHLGATQVIGSLDVGDQVKLGPHAHRVSIETVDNHYVGRLPDDISRRIIKLTQAGNEYEAIVRSATPSHVKIFIRETKKGESVKDIPSFPQTEKPNYITFTPPDLIHEEKPETETFEEEYVKERF